MSAPCILIVEDDEAIQELVHTALEYAGYGVVNASNGKEALAMLEEHQPDLIFLDMLMPVMNGWNFLAAYHTLSGACIPIIAVSAYTEDPQSIPCVEAFITKPFGLAPLLELVDTLVGRPENSASRSEQV